ncbi:MAG: hypothetical protein Q7R76_07155 [Candidatus Woesearchaeota archaeon]|nr:hypothetical protein [Candidatus Woesearchaeota archaeon]
MAFVGNVGTALKTLLNNSILALPGIVAAVIILVLGYIIAALIGWVVTEFLDRIRLDRRVQSVCKSEVIRNAELSDFVGTIVKWYIFLLFLGQAVELVDLGVLTGFLTLVVGWLPNLIVAVILIILALILGDYVAAKIIQTKIKGAKPVSQLLYFSILTLVGVISLKQIGIDVSILENIILAVVGALAIGIGLALGISLGLGLKDDAKKFLKDINK